MPAEKTVACEIVQKNIIMKMRRSHNTDAATSLNGY